jgi:predicted metal-dependent phosphoesterase TrpH
MQYKVDFHTHSIASPDGGLTEIVYRWMLEREGLQCIAITDHNTIELAQRLNQELGDKIIIGEEITTTKGEIIGLYLTEVIPPLLSPMETVDRIHKQGGLVYIPHPFETARKGIQLSDLDMIADKVDIMEIHNGRAVFQNRSPRALTWVLDHSVPGAASSDAHGISGWGRTYTVVSKMPRRENLIELLKHAEYRIKSPGVRGVLYPKFNRIRKWRRHA